MDIIKKLAQELTIKEEQAKAAVQLIDEGNTIPFIARYRKEMTGALNDETLRNLHERLLYLRNLEEKKECRGSAETVTQINQEVNTANSDENKSTSFDNEFYDQLSALAYKKR